MQSRLQAFGQVVSKGLRVEPILTKDDLPRAIEDDQRGKLPYIQQLLEALAIGRGDGPARLVDKSGTALRSWSIFTERNARPGSARKFAAT